MARKKAPGKTVQTAAQKALAVIYDDAETGFEDTTGEDYALPFLKLLQKMSPEVDPDDGGFVSKAKVGQFYNNATALLSDTVEVVPCHYRRAMVEWKPQDAGGGFVAQHEVGIEVGLEREGGKFITEDGTEIADTRYFFCLQITEDGPQPVVVSLSSTQIKKAKSWLTRMQALKMTGPDNRRSTMPMFANVWRLGDIPESNDKGSWRGYKIDLVGPVNDPELAQAAKDARQMFTQMAHRVKPPEEGGAAATENEDDIPF